MNQSSKLKIAESTWKIPVDSRLLHCHCQQKTLKIRGVKQKSQAVKQKRHTLMAFNALGLCPLHNRVLSRHFGEAAARFSSLITVTIEARSTEMAPLAPRRSPFPHQPRPSTRNSENSRLSVMVKEAPRSCDLSDSKNQR